MPMHRVLLSDAIWETRESGGRFVACDLGFWHFTRELSVPFRPRRGLVLVTDSDEQDEPIYFRIKRLVWDVTQNAWICYGDFSVVIPHESTAEVLKERFPDWEMEWIDDHCFDESGNLVPKEER